MRPPSHWLPGRVPGHVARWEDGFTYRLWVFRISLGKDCKDGLEFSHLQAPCLFKAANSHLTSWSGKTDQWKTSGWSVRIKMSLLLQNIIRHIQDKYLKPNHFLMRYDGDNFLALFHFLLICKRYSCLWPVSCSHWNQVHSSCVQIFRIRYNWVSLHKPLNVPARSQCSCG